MGLFDRSSSTTNLTEENYQQILTENRAISEVSGLNVAEVGGDVEIAIDQVDSGVVAAAENLGSGALAIAGDIAASVMRANEDAIDAVKDVSLESIFTSRGIAGDSIRAQNDITEYALQNSRNVTSDALSFGEQAIRSTQETLADITERSLSTLNSAVTGAANATRSDASEVLTNITKYGAIAIAVIAAAFLFTRVKA